MIINKWLLTLIAIAIFTFFTILLWDEPPIEIKSRFNNVEIDWINNAGNASLTGYAYIHWHNSNTENCNANEVSLVPVSSYSKERMNALYGNALRGENYKNRITEPSAEYLLATRNTMCDFNGKFRFDNVPAGEWFLLTKVSYMSLMQRVSIPAEGKIEVILTRCCNDSL